MVDAAWRRGRVIVDAAGECLSPERGNMGHFRLLQKRFEDTPQIRHRYALHTDKTRVHGGPARPIHTYFCVADGNVLQHTEVWSLWRSCLRFDPPPKKSQCTLLGFMGALPQLATPPEPPTSNRNTSKSRLHLQRHCRGPLRKEVSLVCALELAKPWQRRGLPQPKEVLRQPHQLPVTHSSQTCSSGSNLWSGRAL